ncbi:probable LRR receptor-like serine/threonine-protein kinase At1g05700 [Oryza glaberrima]|uniref:probable LRR receptor-like serine/threonine-protein kinase At1g05700 n=1 Tax=Oryza glaberrima TaxID=4538 RepID=UPI00224C11FE|nr:probable LRR receptor-like serine/threonine-protein kinase At1g05700 [Oryza glaberrima]
MMERSLQWLLLLLLFAVGVLQSRAQPDSKGTYYINCGIPPKTRYVDNTTNISYDADDGFTDSGSNHNISASYMDSGHGRTYNVRAFPDGVRNCYTLRSLVAGSKYLIRATFMYGNYDGLSKLAVFDLHIGVNFWTTVNITDPSHQVTKEAIVVVPDEFVQVCLINTGAGTPFISGLDLRPLENRLYPQVNATQGLVQLARLNFGPTNGTIRFPSDPYDRMWDTWIDANDTRWNEISTRDLVQKEDNDPFDPPMAVMQTAIRPRNAADNIQMYWEPELETNGQTRGFIAIFYFSELESVPNNASRQFYINLNGVLWLPNFFEPRYLKADAVYATQTMEKNRWYNISIDATANSTLPPLINGGEVFFVISTANIGTNSEDASAMITIKTEYQVKNNWMGDPCIPKAYVWDRLTCTYSISDRARVTRSNLSAAGLSGDISSSFGNLKAIQYLDLSNNNLTGSIPDVLSQLSSMRVLDLTGNQLIGSIPSGLLKRVQDGSLDLRYGNNPNFCTNGNSCQPAKRKSKLAIYIAVPIVLVVVIVSVTTLLICMLRPKKQGSMEKSLNPQNETTRYVSTSGGYWDNSSLQLENRWFTYKELEKITNNFKQVLGRGGFGYVYHGILEDGTQVAVKLRSESSNQGAKEFLVEAQILTRIHHKNLVSMIGYCKDGVYMALVYEYMSKGTLQEHIAGENNNGGYLTWRERLKIALESAQGLEYLHKGCNPPVIYRDVKATNILLNTRLEAKIADFGLSKAFNNDTHVSTNALVGTLGYMDLEYHATMQPTTKSDVYSFGVVLLELVTGKRAILHNPNPVSIIKWVQQRLIQGNIEDVVDTHMHSDYDVNSVWKVTNIALQCIVQASTQRPTMTDMVMQIQECIELEDGHRAIRNAYNGFNTSDSTDPNSSYSTYVTDQSDVVDHHNAAFETEHILRTAPTLGTGPAAR